MVLGGLRWSRRRMPFARVVGGPIVTTAYPDVTSYVIPIVTTPPRPQLKIV